MKPLEIGEDQKKGLHVSRSQSPVFPLKIGEDQKKKFSRPQSPVFPLKIGEDQKLSAKNQ